MEDTNLEGKKNLKENWLNRSNIEKTFFALVILFSLYGFYPLFVMQVKFLFVPDYPDRWDYLRTSRVHFDHLFMEASERVEDSGKVCFAYSGFTGIALQGYFKGKANYYFYPSEVDTIPVNGEIDIEKLYYCDYSVVLFPGEVTKEDLDAFNSISFLKNIHIDKGGYYSILMYKNIK